MMTAGIVLIAIALVLLFIMRKAPTAAGVAVIPLLIPGVLVLLLSLISEIRTDTKEQMVIIFVGGLVIYAIHFWINWIFHKLF